MNNFDPITFNMMLNMMNNMYPNQGYNMNNYNSYNNQNLMNFMTIWMNNNPILFQLYQNMNQNMNQYLNQNNNNSNKMKFIKVSPSEAQQSLNKKNIQNMNFDASSPFDSSPKTNIVFNTQKGHTTNIIAPYHMKVKDLLLAYVQKLGLGPAVMGDSLFFLFNGNKLKLNEEKTIYDIGLHNGGHIVVLDVKEVIGAKTYTKKILI